MTKQSLKLTKQWRKARRFRAHYERCLAVEHIREKHGLEAFPLFSAVKVEFAGMVLWVESISQSGGVL